MERIFHSALIFSYEGAPREKRIDRGNNQEKSPEEVDRQNQETK